MTCATTNFSCYPLIEDEQNPNLGIVMEDKTTNVLDTWIIDHLIVNDSFLSDRSKLIAFLMYRSLIYRRDVLLTDLTWLVEPSGALIYSTT